MEWDDIATTVWFLPIAAATALILRLVGGRVLKKLQTPEPPRIFPGMFSVPLRAHGPGRFQALFWPLVANKKRI